MTKSLLSKKDLFLPFSVLPRLFIVPLLLFFIYVYFCKRESGIPDIGLCKAGLLFVRVILLVSFFTFVTLITGYMNDEVRLDFDNCAEGLLRHSWRYRFCWYSRYRLFSSNVLVVLQFVVFEAVVLYWVFSSWSTYWLIH